MVKMKPFNLNKDHLRLIHYAVMAIPCFLKALGVIEYVSVKYNGIFAQEYIMIRIKSEIQNMS